ncbi:MAG: type 1 glutamine amidotransferase [Actinomycetota bacterium]|nr:type 1 glutamine amidotransferase [Actinomycetota bacterium]
MSRGRPRALFVRNETLAPPGHLGVRTEQLGFEVVSAPPWDLPDAADFDLVVPLGSAESAYDDQVPWLAGELDWLTRVVGLGVPTLGVCFGAQALSRALGGVVAPLAVPEVGWRKVDSDHPGLIEAGPWLQWHHDTLTVPPGGSLLATNEYGVQAFRWGPHVGVQFHPEATVDIVRGWIDAGSGMPQAAGVEPAQLMLRSRIEAEAARARATRLFDRFCDLALGGRDGGRPGGPSG